MKNGNSGFLMGKYLSKRKPMNYCLNFSITIACARRLMVNFLTHPQKIMLRRFLAHDQQTKSHHAKHPQQNRSTICSTKKLPAKEAGDSGQTGKKAAPGIQLQLQSHGGQYAYLWRNGIDFDFRSNPGQSHAP